MATVSDFSALPAAVAPGQVVRVSVAFTLDPGTPELTGSAELLSPDGAVARTATVVVSGTPAEPMPVVAASPTSGQWSLRVSSGNVVAVGDNTFDWVP